MGPPYRSANDPDRYSEAEFVRILRVAGELQDQATFEAPRGKLTLEEIQSIASEVGIEPHQVAAAAALVSTEAGEQWTRWLATPVRGGVTRTLGGSLPKGSWKEVIAAIRQTMKQEGQHSYVPGALEWIHADAGSEVRVEVTDAGDHTHLQIVADHRQAAALYLAVGPVLGACSAVVPVVAFGLGEPIEAWLLIGGGAGVGWTAAWTALKIVSARWQRRIRILVQELSGVAQAQAGQHPDPPRA